MPTYEYVCSKCGHQWEEVQKISDAPLTRCPHCSKNGAKRQISGGNFILKGGGWYADLYSSSKPSKKDDSGGSSSGSSSKEGSTASEASPATKPDAPAKATGTSGDKS